MTTESFRRLKIWTSRQFYWFGLYCAKHTTIVLLTSGLVITVLVYPALFIQLNSASSSSSTAPPYLSSPSQRLDARSSYATSGVVPPVREIWDGHDALRIRDEAAVVARCGAQSTIAIERLYVRGYGTTSAPNGATSYSGSDREVGPVPALHEAARMQAEIERLLLVAQSHDEGGVPAAASSHHHHHGHPHPLECVTVTEDDGNTRHCFVTSPISGFSPLRDTTPQASDDQTVFLRSLRQSPRILDGVPVDSNSLVAGYSSSPSGVQADDGSLESLPEYLVLTFPLRVGTGECQSTSRHAKWIDLVKRTVGPNGVVKALNSEPDLFALEYNPSGRAIRISRFSALIYLTYIVIFIYSSGSLKRIDTLHDRYGMAFTGIVEIIMSTLCSVSVCELIGFKLNMVPPELLPVIVVFVGAENMFTMIEDVVTTEITLPVRERIAIGLSKSGTSNTFKVVSYNAILGVIGFFATGAIHQFCAFAIVVLVVHWIHINTMFIGVLAIDLHRLELSDHLSQNPLLKSHKPTIANASPSSSPSKSKPKSSKTKGFRGTVAMNGSLLLMLTVAGVLYYMSSSSSKADLDSPKSTFPKPNFSRAAAAVPSSAPLPPVTDDSLDPAVRIWNLFNPSNDKFLHIKIEPPTFVTFSPDGGKLAREKTLPDRRQRPRIYRRLFHRVYNLWKTTIVPSFVTNFLLWLILRYLMQDSELLDAQRHRADGEDEALLAGGGRNVGQNGDRVPSLLSLASSGSEGNAISCKQLERACANDIMLVASSSDASVIVAVSVEHELAVWFERTGRRASIDFASLLRHQVPAPTGPGATQQQPRVSALRSAGHQQRHRATHLALDSRGSWCAVATDGGMLIVWSLARGTATLQCRALVAPHFASQNDSKAIRSISFVKPAGPSPTSPPASSRASRSTSVSSLTSMFDSSSNSSKRGASDMLMITDARGNVFNWAFLISAVPSPVLMGKGKSSLEASLVTTEFVPPASAFWNAARANSLELGGQDEEPATLLCARYLTISGGTKLISVTLSPENSIVIEDTAPGELMCVIDDLRAYVIDQARLSKLDPRPCRLCNTTQRPAIVLAVSANSAVHVYQMPLSTEGGQSCNCTPCDVMEGVHGIASRSRRSSSIHSVNPSKLRHKSSMSSVGQDSPPLPATTSYPMYGHGVHLRRDKNRDSVESELSAFLLPPTTSNGQPDDTGGGSPFLEVHKVALVPCERGTWDLAGDIVVGVRKRASQKAAPKTVDPYVASIRGGSPASSRSSSPFDGWEMWVLDASRVVRASCLSELPHSHNGLFPVEEDSQSNGLFFHPPPLSPNDQSVSMSQSSSEPLPPVRVYPRIPFTRASAFSCSISSSVGRYVVGFGNVALLVTLPARPSPAPALYRRTSASWNGTFSYGSPPR